MKKLWLTIASKNFLIAFASVVILGLLFLWSVDLDKEWIGFWGNVVGGVIGAGVALMLFRMEAARQAKKEQQQLFVHFNLVADGLLRASEEICKTLCYIDGTKELFRAHVRSGYQLYDKAFTENRAGLMSRIDVYIDLDTIHKEFRNLDDIVHAELGGEEEMPMKDWYERESKRVDVFDNWQNDVLMQIFERVYPTPVIKNDKVR